MFPGWVQDDTQPDGTETISEYNLLFFKKKRYRKVPFSKGLTPTVTQPRKVMTQDPGGNTGLSMFAALTWI